jgi:hypothetical protein
MWNRGNRVRSGRRVRRGSRRGSVLRRLRHCMGGERKRDGDQDRCNRYAYSTHVFLPPLLVVKRKNYLSIKMASLTWINHFRFLLANAFDSELFVQ